MARLRRRGHLGYRLDVSPTGENQMVDCSGYLQHSLDHRPAPCRVRRKTDRDAAVKIKLSRQFSS